MHRYAGIAVWSLSMTLTTSNLFAQGRLGVDFTPKLIPIVEGIYAYEGPLSLPGEDEIVRTNSLVVITDDGVVVVDGQDNLEEAERLVRAIAGVTPLPIRYLINASPHPDHVNGNAAFVDATIVAHERAHEAMMESGVPLPTIVYADRMTLHLGGKTLELRYYGPAHSAGDSVVYIPEDRVAFLSELYFNGVFTSVSEGFAVNHLKALESIKTLDAEWFIPGHGYIEDQSAAELRAGLDRYHANVKAVHDVVARHVAASDSLEETLSDIHAELGEFSELPFYGFLMKRSVEATYNALAGDAK